MGNKRMNLKDSMKLVEFLLSKGCKIEDNDGFKVDTNTGDFVIPFDGSGEYLGTLSVIYDRCNIKNNYSLKFSASFLAEWDGNPDNEPTFDWEVSWVGANCHHIKDVDEFEDDYGIDLNKHMYLYKEFNNPDDIKNFFGLYKTLVKVVEDGCLYKLYSKL